MIIVLTGADGTGKSTAIKCLQEEHPEGIFLKGSWDSDYDVDSMRYQINAYRLFIYDRFPLLDDLVYSRIFAKKPSKYLQCGDIIELLSKLRIIYFDCPTSEIQYRLEQRGDEFITSDMIQSIKDDYEILFRIADLKPHRIDASQSPWQVYKQTKEAINEILYR